jgi:hypothetical protein
VRDKVWRAADQKVGEADSCCFEGKKEKQYECHDSSYKK